MSNVNIAGLLGFATVAEGSSVDFRDPSFAAASGAKVGLAEVPGVSVSGLLGFSSVADGASVDFRDPSFAAASGAKVGGEPIQ